MTVSWVVAFPTITVLLILLDPVMGSWPLTTRTFVLTLIMVPIMAVATPPVARRLIGKPRQSQQTTNLENRNA